MAESFKLVPGLSEVKPRTPGGPNISGGTLRKEAYSLFLSLLIGSTRLVY